jgi:uncharacterized protein (DUF488 family)
LVPDRRVLFTIGFGRRSAASFFGALREAQVSTLVDVRLHNTSQLAGFTKRDDLPFFLRELCDADYVNDPVLAPTEDLLARYRADHDWPAYERDFRALIRRRRIEQRVERFADRAVLLCSEPSADHCHRRVVAEHLASKWGNLDVIHL